MIRFRFSAAGPHIRRENSSPTLVASYTPTELSTVLGPQTAVRDMVRGDVTITLAPTANLSSNPPGATFATVTPSASIDGTLLTTGGVTARVVADLNGRGVWFDVPHQSGASVVDAITSFDTGSLAEHMYAQILALAEGHTPADASLAAFSSYSGSVDAGSLVAVRNASGLMSGLDVSCVSVGRTGKANDAFPVTLISPRHGLTAAHVLPAVGYIYAFIDTSGTIVYGTVAGVSNLGSDIAVVYFDGAIAGVTPAKTFPATVGGKLSLPNTASVFPCIYKTMHRLDGTDKSCWLPQLTGNFTATLFSAFQDTVYGAAYTTLRAPLLSFQYSRGIGGDSGSPWFTLVNGELCLLGAWYTGASASNILFSMRASVVTAMNDLAAVDDPLKGAYALQEVDVSTFNSY